MEKKDKEHVQKMYNGIIVDSEEEVMVLQWLHELQEANYVKRVERAETFQLSEPVVNEYIELKQLKKSVKNINKTQKLLEGHVYTPEFKVVWNRFNNAIVAFPNGGNRKRDEILLSGMNYDNNRTGEVVTYIEVKPGWDQNNMTRLFKINQKWMWDKYKIFVNLIQPHELFSKTFTPQRWLKTPTGKNRVINWEVWTVEEYLSQTK